MGAHRVFPAKVPVPEPAAPSHGIHRPHPDTGPHQEGHGLLTEATSQGINTCAMSGIDRSQSDTGTHKDSYGLLSGPVHGGLVGMHGSYPDTGPLSIEIRCVVW